MSLAESELFELRIELPNPELERRSRRLVGFDTRYAAVHNIVRLLIDPQALTEWSKRLYGSELALLEVLKDRYPMVLFEGTVGTGKTETALGISDRMARELKREACAFKLSTRVRGAGLVGQMSTLLNQAFEEVASEAGKNRFAFLVIDEADSLGSARETNQAHHEDRVAVNTLIQRIDGIRKHGGRVLVFLCTNLIGSLDPAVVRRAAYVERFSRPSPEERLELLTMDLQGMGFGTKDLEDLVELTGPAGKAPGYTYSDIRTRLIPDAIARAYPDRRVSVEDFRLVLEAIAPSPPMDGEQ